MECTFSNPERGSRKVRGLFFVSNLPVRKLPVTVVQMTCRYELPPLLFRIVMLVDAAYSCVCERCCFSAELNYIDKGPRKKEIHL